MTILGAERPAEVLGEARLPGSSSYLRGKDSDKWIRGVPHYERVRLKGVRPGVDVLFYHRERQLEYDLELAAGANADTLGVRFEGQRTLAIRDGDLIVETDAGQIRQRKPEAWQDINGQRRGVAVEYVLARTGQVRFRLGAYDRKWPLRIDPVIVYGTYLPATPTAIAVNAAGEVYLTGIIWGTDFPATSGTYDASANGSHDAFVMKLDATGTTVLFATYLGSTSSDSGTAIALDALGNIYVAGNTSGTNFPTTYDVRNGAGPHTAFLTKLNSSGTAMAYSLLFPSSAYDAKALAVDSSYRAYIAVPATSFSTTAGAYRATSAGSTDIGLAVVNPAGTNLLYGTLLGGSLEDTPLGITVDAAGAVYVTGTTYSSNFPTTSGAFSSTLSGTTDAFVAKLNPSLSGAASLVFSTYLGGSNSESGNAIAVDAGGVYVAGDTRSIDFPTTPGAYGGPPPNDYYNHGFVTKLNAAGSALVYSTYLASSGDDTVYGINVDAAGQAILAGTTYSATFPTTPGAVMRYTGSSYPVFLTVLSADGSSVPYSAVFGPKDYSSSRGLSYDGQNAYVLATTSYDLPTTSGSYRSNRSSTGPIGYLVKVNLNSTVSCTYSVNPTLIDIPDTGGTGSFDLTVPAGCAWVPIASSPITLTSHKPVVGGGYVDFSVLPASAGSAQKSYTITAGEATVTVRQAAGNCAHMIITPSPVSFPAAGGLRNLQVVTPSGCGWSAVSATGWLTVNSISGNTISLYAAPNSFGARTTTLQVGSGSVTVSQDGGSCTLALSTTAASFPAQGGTGGIPFTASSSDCNWSAWTNSNWIRVDSPSGTGSSTVAFTVMANPVGAARTGTVNIDGQAITVTQPAGTPAALDAYWISAFAGNSSAGTAGDGGPATSAGLYQPAGMAVDPSGNVIVAEGWGARIRKVAPSGVIATLIGGGSSVAEGELALEASVSSPVAVAVSPAGLVHYAEPYCVRKLDTDGRVYTVAGTGLSSGSLGDNGPAASATLNAIGGIAFDSTGNLYIAERFGHRVRKVDTQGVITTVTGTGAFGFSGDGDLATAAKVNSPSAVLVDSQGNLYISDSGNHRVRMVGSDGRISTIAGNGTSTFSGDGGSPTAASLFNPGGLALDVAGNLLIADRNNRRIRRVNSSGIITTIAGNGSSSHTGDGGPALSAGLYFPAYLAGDNSGNLYFSDNERRVRKLSLTRLCTYSVTPLTVSTLEAASSLSFTVTPSDAACAWTVTSAAAWLTVDSGSAGTGNGTVGVSVAENLGGTSRSGVLTIAGKNIVISQGDSCAYGINPSSATQVAVGGVGSVNVTASPAGCSWTASSNDSFLSITSGSTGTGNGAVNYSVAANPNGPPRNGSLTIAGKTFSLTQAGLGCEVTLGSTGISVGAGAMPTASFAVTVAQGCSWAATSNASWLTSGSSGSGSGTVSYSVAANSGAARTGTITVGGKTFTVNQAATPTYLITTVAGGGLPLTPVPALNASIRSPESVMVDQFGNVYFSSLNCVYKVDGSGVLIRVAGSSGAPGYSGDGGPANNARLSGPRGLALDANGNLFIADSGNSAVRKVNPDGVISTVATLSGVAAVAVDGAGNLFMAYQGRVYKVANGLTTAVAGTGTLGYSGDGGPAIAAQTSYVHGLAVDTSGNLYIADTGNNRVRKLLPNGNIITVAGNGVSGSSGDGGQATSAQIGYPRALALDASGNLYIAGSVYVRKVATNGIITTVAGTGTDSFSPDGVLAAGAPLGYVYGVAADATGNVYIAEATNRRIRKVSNGILTTVAGNGTSGYSADGIPATGDQLGSSSGVALDSAGNLYIADTENHRVRKVTPAGYITTVAGTGEWGYSGDGGPATSARLSYPQGVAVDTAGNLYIADRSNSRVRKVATNGVITTVAGSSFCCNAGDGGLATNAWVGSPMGVTLDATGNLYIAEFGNRVRKVTPAGIITTVAGTGVSGYSGDGGPAVNAQLYAPHSVAVDTSGNLYIADTYNRRIRKVAPNGTITTVAGGGTGGVGGQATDAQLLKVSSVAVDPAGNIYIGDEDYCALFKVAPDGIVNAIAGNGLGFCGYFGDGGPGVGAGARISVRGCIALDPVGRIYFSNYKDFSNYGGAVRVLIPTGAAPLLSVTAYHSDITIADQTFTSLVTVRNASNAGPTSGIVTVTEIVPTGLTVISMAGDGWSCSSSTCTRSDTLAGGHSYPPIIVAAKVASNATSQLTNLVSVSGGGASGTSAIDTITVLNVAGPLRFVPIAPCRIADTRNPNGSFGGPRFAGGQTRDFLIPASDCAIPSNALAYALNVTAVPAGPLGYITVWPTGKPQPFVSTLNSIDGQIQANAAIVPAGTSGAISVFASNPTDLVLDINGYFVPATEPAALAFYPVAPCRITDTRDAGGPISGGSSRAVSLAGSCGIPATAQAYSLNVTAVPQGPLGYVTVWPLGSVQPQVSTLNAISGVVTANAAIVRAGAGAINVFASNTTDIVIDVNGYFAPPGAGGLQFYAAEPCRVVDTRRQNAPLGGPAMTGAGNRAFVIPSGPCGVPTAGAYSLNATVVPSGALGYLTLWKTDITMPGVSTLNALDASITANAAIVPASSTGSINAFGSNPTQLILDLNGYFAP